MNDSTHRPRHRTLLAVALSAAGLSIGVLAARELCETLGLAR